MDLLIEMPSKIQIGDAAKVLAQLNKDPRDYENQWVSEFVSESLIGSSVTVREKVTYRYATKNSNNNTQIFYFLIEFRNCDKDEGRKSSRSKSLTGQ